MKIFIPIKSHSARLKDKNFRWIGHRTLWKRAIDKFRETKVYIDTDSEALLDKRKELENLRLTIYRRDPELVGDEVPVNKLINYFLDNYVKDSKEVIVQTHVTSPFVTEDHIKDATKYMKRTRVDSVFSVTYRQVRMWMLGEPLNFDADGELLPTQQLPIVAEENSAFYIFTKGSFKKHGRNNRIGTSPYMFPLEFPYNLDIDTQLDWDLCRVVHTMMNPRIKELY